MQSATGADSHRSLQRRSPPVDPETPSSVHVRSVSPGLMQTRNSAASVKSNHSGGGRRQNGGQSIQSRDGVAPPLSQIEKSVTHLLVATKQLLETLTQWSRGSATDSQVSDVYVRLGYEFNIACRAFTAINVETTDLGDVPESLRGILEQTLSQEASVESLEKYLPRIRDIIISLLHGLKRKQQKLRQKQSRENGNGDALPRNSSVTSVSSTSTGLTTMLDQGIKNGFQGDSASMDRTGSRDAAIPPRGSSAGRRGLVRDLSRGSVSSNPSTLSSNTMQNMPVLPPYPGDEVAVASRPETSNLDVGNFPPPPPPKTQNALVALQNGGDLERRASRRYSAYQISKHLGASPIGVPMLPPTQKTPIPNRGRNDDRESMKAMQVRGDRHMRQNSSRLNNELSPARIPSRISEESSVHPVETIRPEEPVRDGTPTEKLHRKPTIDDPPTATVKGPPPDTLIGLAGDSVVEKRPQTPQHKTSIGARTSSPRGRAFTPEDSPRSTKELTIFLQYKTKVKKFVFADGCKDLSMARLQLAFIEKFAWNTYNNGVDLPEIYIQDPVSGVRHELEDLNDVKDRVVLVLNVEVLDEVKRHIDQGIGGLKKIVEGVRTVLDDQQATIQRVADRQNDTTKEIVRISTVPSRTSVVDSPRTNGACIMSKSNNEAQLTEIQSLRQDLAILRQTYSSFQSDVQSSMSTIRTKADSVKTIALKTSVPDVKGGSGRAYVNAGKKGLNVDSDKLVSQVDDLQDIVEDLRKDVVTRGVRPLPRQLEVVAKDISQATMELKRMQEFLKRERPIWTKIWEKELQTVCNDREEMTMQEDLAADLQDDLEKATQTFALVEQATKEQLKDAPGNAQASRILSRGLNHVSAADPTAAKEGFLGEVRALQPNHENRLEAIERAEKMRQKELENRRGGEFQKELGKFVEDGKLKKSGGFEEVERARKAKDDRIRREVWERQNGIVPSDTPNADGGNGDAAPVEDSAKAEPAPI